MQMDKSVVVAICTLLFMMFVQAATAIWWASHTTTVQNEIVAWRKEHQAQQDDYPVLKNRVTNLEENTDKLLKQMADFLAELREMKEKPNDARSVR